jgi:hypothetical protein
MGTSLQSRLLIALAIMPSLLAACDNPVGSTYRAGVKYLLDDGSVAEYIGDDIYTSYDDCLAEAEGRFHASSADNAKRRVMGWHCEKMEGKRTRCR